MRSSLCLIYKLSPSLSLSPYTHSYTFIPSLIKSQSLYPIMSRSSLLAFPSCDHLLYFPLLPLKNSTSITLTQGNQGCCSSSLKLHNRELNTAQETFTIQTEIQVNSPFPLSHIYLIVSLTQILDGNKSFSLSHCIPTLNAKNNYIIITSHSHCKSSCRFCSTKNSHFHAHIVSSVCKTHCCSVSIIWLRKKKNMLIE